MDEPTKAAVEPTKLITIDEAPFLGGEGGDDSWEGAGVGLVSPESVGGDGASSPEGAGDGGTSSADGEGGGEEAPVLLLLLSAMTTICNFWFLTQLSWTPLMK